MSREPLGVSRSRSAYAESSQSWKSVVSNLPQTRFRSPSPQLCIGQVCTVCFQLGESEMMMTVKEWLSISHTSFYSGVLDHRKFGSQPHVVLTTMRSDHPSDFFLKSLGLSPPSVPHSVVVPAHPHDSKAVRLCPLSEQPAKHSPTMDSHREGR